MLKTSSLVAGVIAVSLGVVAPAMAQQNPTAAQTEAARNNPCSDPWVSLAVSVAKTRGSSIGRAAGSGGSSECNIMLYGGGQWSSYADLLAKVRATQVELARRNVQFSMVNGEGRVTMINPAAGIDAANVIAAGAGNLVGAGAGNLVGAGAGNLVGAGAGNLVGAGAGNLVGAGAGNLVGTGIAEVKPRGYSLNSNDGARFSFPLPGGGSLRVK